MCMNSFNTFGNVPEARPTLPPLHSLNLPIPRISHGKAKIDCTSISPVSDFNELTHVAHNITPHQGKTRIISETSVSSIPSTCSNPLNSHSPSPSLSEASTTLATSSRSSGSFRLIPCGIEDADAIVLVTEPTHFSNDSQALLLVGPAVRPYRLPSSRLVANGARICPYRITPSQCFSRRSSTFSVQSQPN